MSISQPSPAPSQDDGYCIALQPICDEEYRHIADELLYRDSIDAEDATFDDPLKATARASSVAIYEIGLDKLIGERSLFMNVSREWLERPELLPLPPERVVIEVLESVTNDERTLAALNVIKARGYRIALDDYVLDAGNASLLHVADIIKIDFSAPVDEKPLSEYRRHGCTLLAEKVETLEDFEHAKQLGFHLYQGFFFARPQNFATPLTQRRSNNSIQIKLVRELYRETVSLERVADMISQDPHLYVTVIKRANSSYYQAGESNNLKRSLQLLGLNELRTLVATVMLAQNGPVCRLTMQHALTRAFMCKHLVAPFRNIDPEDAFTTGLFSLMGAMLGIEMDDLLREVPLSDEILQALRYNTGTLGAILTLARDYQELQSDPNRTSPASDELRACYLKGVEETQAMMKLI